MIRPTAAVTPGRWLLVVDPGLRRAHTALRTVLAVSGGTGFAFGLMQVGGAAPELAALGALVALLGCLTMPDATRADQGWHLVRLTSAAGVSAALAAALTPWPPAGYPALLVVVGVAAWATRWGPPGSAVGLVLFIGHLVPFFITAGAGDVGWLVVSALAGGSATAATVLLVLPRRPARVHQRLSRSLAASLDVLVERTLACLPRTATSRHNDRALRTLATVQSVALAVDSILDEPGVAPSGGEADDRRSQVLRTEVLADHLAWSVLGRLERPADDATTEAARHRRVWRTEGGGPPRDAPAPRTREPGPTMTGNVLAELAASRWGPAGTADVPTTGTHPTRGAASTPPPGPDDPAPLADPTATVVQSLLACTAAIAVGLVLSPTYWYWAVIGAFIVVTTTPSRGVGVRKAIDRTLGTAIGAGLGLALGTVMAGQHSLQIALVALLAVGAIWILQVSYTWMMALITVLIVLGYDLLGQPATEVLLPRLTETAAGALVGALAVFFVLPASTRSSVDTELHAVLAALDDLLAHLDRDELPPPLDTIRALDRAVGELHDTTRPLLTNVPIRIRDDVRAVRLLARAARFRARRLATIVDRPLAPHERELLTQVRHRLTQLREDLDAPPAEVATSDPSDDPTATGDGAIAATLRALDERLAAYQSTRQLLDAPTRRRRTSPSPSRRPGGGRSSYFRRPGRTKTPGCPASPPGRDRTGSRR